MRFLCAASRSLHCPCPIFTSCLQSVIAPKRIDRFWCAWCQLLAFFKLYIIHVKKLMINQKNVELWGIGCQSPPDAWFSHLNFGNLSKKCHSSQTSWLIFVRLVAFTCIFEALHDSCQKIKNRSRKSRVMGCKRNAFFVCHLKKSAFPIPILTSCLRIVIAPKRIDRFWCAWCQSLAFSQHYMIHIKKSKIE